MLHRVEVCSVQGIESYGIRQTDSRHIERHRQGIESKQRSEADICSSMHAVETGKEHENSSQTMAEAQHLLGWKPSVGYYADNTGHKKRHKTLNRVEPEYIFAESHAAEINTH